MIEEFFVYNDATGEPHRVLYSDATDRAFVVDQGQRIEAIRLVDGFRFIGKPRENVLPETLALMFGKIYQQPENYRKMGEAAATLIRESSLHVVPTLLKMVVEVSKGRDSQLPWQLKVYEEKTHEVFLYVDGFEDWHYAKTFASWYLVDLADAQVSMDYNYKIEKDDGK